MILTPETFRAAHPELASRAWIEETPSQRFICWHDRLLDRVERRQLGVELCDACEQPDCDCAGSEINERLAPRRTA